MNCPRCGRADVSTIECPRCGVVVAKARTRRTPPPARPSPARPRAELPDVTRAARVEPASWPRRPLAGLALLLASAVGVWLGLRGREAHLTRTPAQPAAAADPGPEAPAPPRFFAQPSADPAQAARSAEALESAVAATEADRHDRERVEGDRSAAAALAEKLTRGRTIGSADLAVAEGLFARYPEQARGLLESALLASAADLRANRRYAEALARLERAAAVSPGSVDVRRGVVAVRSDAGDWPGVEAAARALLALAPGDAAGTRSFAYALVRQDRTREAIEALSAYLDGRSDAEAAALLDRLRRERAAEGGFEEQRLAHFHVRYDGEAHEDVGREILRVLDRHYATLRTAFDHEPAAPITVILFSTRSYYDATGAPAWSGGEYDHYDGRIRVPIGGLSASLTPDIESTLLHEVTHAFVTDLSGGLAPREIQEGLAQWTEGRRSADVLGDRGLSALADGRIRGVTGFYLASLVLVEDLVAQRGRSGVNDLLAAMARTGNVDAAFQEVYGRTFAGLQAETGARLRQRHGS